MAATNKFPSPGKHFGENQEKNVIQTDSLFISGHLLRWANVVLQISNISLITTTNLQKPAFPSLCWISLFLGAFFFTLNGFFLKFLGLLLLAFSVYLAYQWYMEYQSSKTSKCLHIHMNSGRVFSIVFRSQDFLTQVLNVFANIFEQGGQASSEDIHIDIQNCSIDMQECSFDNQSSLINSVNSTEKPQ